MQIKSILRRILESGVSRIFADGRKKKDVWPFPRGEVKSAVITKMAKAATMAYGQYEENRQREAASFLSNFSVTATKEVDAAKTLSELYNSAI